MPSLPVQALNLGFLPAGSSQGAKVEQPPSRRVCSPRCKLLLHTRPFFPCFGRPVKTKHPPTHTHTLVPAHSLGPHNPQGSATRRDESTEKAAGHCLQLTRELERENSAEGLLCNRQELS